jgi:hypothetical protein
MAWRRIPAVVVAAAIMSAIGAATLPAAALGHGDQEVQSPAAARESDLRAVAEGNGWTVAQARAQDAAWREVARINRRVSAERRDIYVGAALSEAPGDAPTLYIKGPAPGFVRDLVADARVPIRIVDEQPYSFDELERRKMRVHDALVEMGYEEVSTGFDITDAGRIDSAVLGTRGLPSDRASVLERIPADLRPSVDVTVVDKSYGNGDNAIGGARIWNAGALTDLLNAQLRQIERLIRQVAELRPPAGG